MSYKITKNVNVGYVYSPLNITCGIAIEGTVPSRQEYDISEGSYFPDYTLTHLVLRPWVAVSDPDGVRPEGQVDMSATIANARWERIEDGVTTAIVSSDTGDFTAIGDASAGTGLLTIRRNAQPEKPLTLVFSCTYVDPASGDTYPLTMTHVVECDSVDTYPVLTLDVPETVYYNPVGGRDRFTLTPTLRKGSNAVDPSQYELRWEMLRSVGTDGKESWTAVGAGDYDYEAQVSADATTCDILCECMGEGITLRVWAAYDPYGNPSAITTYHESYPMRRVRFVRRYPRYDAQVHVARHVVDGTAQLHGRAAVVCGNELLADPDQYFGIKWFTQASQTSGQLNALTDTGLSGAEVMIPITAAMMNRDRGLNVAIDVEPLPDWRLLVDGTGRPIADASGNVIIAR